MAGYLTTKTNQFFKSESWGGIILLVAVAISLLLANSDLGEGFQSLLRWHMGSPIMRLSIIDWINDGLMAIFFFFVGLEIKHELIDGHLSSFKKASVPVAAAIGGAVLPGLLYFSINRGGATAAGWGIPMATDIAFALGVLSILGKLVPPALKAFLTTLAVVDDLLAIIVIAVFYVAGFHWEYFLAGLAVFALLLAINKIGVKHTAFYILPGIVMWYLIHHSGIHATIAGVLTAIAIPNKSAVGSPLRRLSRNLNKPVNFFIMPLFALANTNIRFTSNMLSDVASRLGLGIIVGLLVGKPVGIMLASWLTTKLKIGMLPQGIYWRHITAMGILAGIGFTMSIFMAFLSFGNSAYNTEAKFATLLASTLAGLIGYALLKKQLKSKLRS